MTTFTFFSGQNNVFLSLLPPTSNIERCRRPPLCRRPLRCRHLPPLRRHLRSSQSLPAPSTGGSTPPRHFAFRSHYTRNPPSPPPYGSKGPLAFVKEEYNGSLPNLVLTPHSWTKVSSIIFVDLPVSTGFSYARTESAAQKSDWLLVYQAHEFLRKWLVDHPEYLSNEVYVGGDSYSGIILPVIVQEISQGNEKGVQPLINLQGYVLGNPITCRTEDNYKIPFAHGMGLISDELYESLQKNCKGEYINVDPRNVLCSKDLESFHKTISGVNLAQILEPLCEYASPKPLEVSTRRSLYEKHPWKFINSQLTLPSLSCRVISVAY